MKKILNKVEAIDLIRSTLTYTIPEDKNLEQYITLSKDWCCEFDLLAYFIIQYFEIQNTPMKLQIESLGYIYDLPFKMYIHINEIDSNFVDVMMKVVCDKELCINDQLEEVLIKLSNYEL